MTRLFSPARMAGTVLVVMAAASCTQSGSTLPADWETKVVGVRESVWRDWFAGGAGLDQLLTADFVGIGFGDGPWDTKATTMAGSRDFAAGGAKLASLSFSKTTMQNYGNVVVVYSNYELSFTSANGETTKQQGRATEIFVWQDGRWVHPGWHLDSGQ